MPEYRIDANGNAIVIDDDDSSKQLTAPLKKKKTSQYLILICAAIVCCYILFGQNSSIDISAVSLGNSIVSVTSNHTTRVSFTAPSAGTYVFTSTGQNDTYGYLYESATASSALASDDDSGSNQNFRIERTLRAGQNVFIGVKFYASDKSGNITLQISKVSATSSTLTSSSQAIVQQVRTGNNTVAINVGRTTRVKFVAPSSGTYIFMTNGSVDTYGYLYSTLTGTSPIRENDDYSGNQNFRIDYFLSENQTIYVGIKYYSNDESGNVILNIAKETGDTSNNWPVGETCRVYVSSGNARSGPGVSGYARVAYIYNDNQFVILDSQLGDTGKDWYKIRINDQLCWISSGLVELNGNRNGTRNGVPLYDY